MATVPGLVWEEWDDPAAFGQGSVQARAVVPSQRLPELMDALGVVTELLVGVDAATRFEYGGGMVVVEVRLAACTHPQEQQEEAHSSPEQPAGAPGLDVAQLLGVQPPGDPLGDEDYIGG